MELIERLFTYQDDGETLQGFIAYDGDLALPLPVVMVSHAWAGRTAFFDDKARALAKLGYIGFALDMYGDGKVGQNNTENSQLMSRFTDDRAKLQSRMQLALAIAQQLPGADPDKIAAIGFCFGGMCVLDLARTGSPLNGVISFHGLLNPPGNTEDRKIQTKILALHGHDDPMVPPAQVLAFQEEMTRAGADWQMHIYGHTLHAFTNPAAQDPEFGTVYQPDAERRSWVALQNFLAELF